MDVCIDCVTSRGNEGANHIGEDKAGRAACKVRLGKNCPNHAILLHGIQYQYCFARSMSDVPISQQGRFAAHGTLRGSQVILGTQPCAGDRGSLPGSDDLSTYDWAVLASVAGDTNSSGLQYYRG